MFMLVIVLLAGLGLGGGAGCAAILLLGAKPAAAAEAPKPPPEPKFVPVGSVLAPLVGADGRLSGYVKVDVQLQVDEDKMDYVKARIPMLLHAVNMRTFATPLASGPDGMLPNLDGFRRVVEASSSEAFGAGMVKRVALTAAVPS
ncbi:hypothetical protein [Sphingomonas sp.]|uniref:hypothetical protein n=1 Tax=Sphingomonas sp. TaxID=28214 RepID=UPI0034543A7C